MDVPTLQSRLERNEPTVILDVRRAPDRVGWTIPGAIGVDVYESMARGEPGPLATLDLPKDRPVIAVCYAGNTSRVVAGYLQSRGIKAESLDGGMRAWSGAWNTSEMKMKDGTRVLQVRRTGRGCLSYVLVSGAEALVVDASVAPDVYESIAKKAGARIVGALDTHVHADHITRTPQIARHLSVPYRVSARAKVAYDHAPLSDGDTITFGAAHLDVLATPGHTWDSLTFQLPGGPIFTGDTLFPDGVGRPDLGAGKTEIRDRASALHASIQRLGALPGGTAVMPAHASEPLPFHAPPWAATIDEIRRRVALFGMKEAEFVDTVVARIGEVPPTYATMVTANRLGAFPGAAETDMLEAAPNRCAAG